MRMLNDDFNRRNYNKGYENHDAAFRNLSAPKVSSLEFKFKSQEDMQGFLADNNWTIEKIKDYINVNIKCDQNKMTLIFDGNENNVLLACSFVEQLSQVKPFTSGLNRNDFEMLLSAYVKKNSNLDLFNLSNENLGFLSSDEKDKIQPYMQPCLDALNEILNKDDLNKLICEGKIKMQDLAYARGVTWTNSNVVIDEA